MGGRPAGMGSDLALTEYTGGIKLRARATGCQGRQHPAKLWRGGWNHGKGYVNMFMPNKVMFRVLVSDWLVMFSI